MLPARANRLTHRPRARRAGATTWVGTAPQEAEESVVRNSSREAWTVARWGRPPRPQRRRPVRGRRGRAGGRRRQKRAVARTGRRRMAGAWRRTGVPRTTSEGRRRHEREHGGQIGSRRCTAQRRSARQATTWHNRGRRARRRHASALSLRTPHGEDGGRGRIAREPMAASRAKRGTRTQRDRRRDART